MFLKYIDFIFVPFRAINNKIVHAKSIKGNIQVDINRVKGMKALGKNELQQFNNKMNQFGQPQQQQGAHMQQAGQPPGMPGAPGAPGAPGMPGMPGAPPGMPPGMFGAPQVPNPTP